MSGIVDRFHASLSLPVACAAALAMPLHAMDQPAEEEAGPGYQHTTDIHDRDLVEHARVINRLYQERLVTHIGQVTNKSLSTDERVAAIRALDRMLDPSVIPHLLPMLHLERPEPLPVYSAATHALVRLQAQEAVKFWSAAREANHPDHYLIAFNALRGVKAEDSIEYRRYLNSPVATLRADALLGEQNLNEMEAIPALVEALAGDRKASNRRFAAWLLGRVDDTTDAGPALTRALADPNPKVRSEVALSVARLDYKPALPTLFLMMEITPGNPDLLIAITAITGEDFGYHPLANIVERRQATDRAFKWLADRNN